MESKSGTVHELNTTFYAHERICFKKAQFLSSSYTKTIVVITPLMKFGGAVILNLLGRTTSTVRVALVTQRHIDAESLRAQLPFFVRIRLITRECELQSPLSIKIAVLWLRMMLQSVDIIVHLKPLVEESAINIPGAMKALLSANSYSNESFRREFVYYFGNDIHYVQLDFPLTENPTSVVQSVIDKCVK